MACNCTRTYLSTLVGGCSNILYQQLNDPGATSLTGGPNASFLKNTGGGVYILSPSGGLCVSSNGVVYTVTSNITQQGQGGTFVSSNIQASNIVVGDIIINGTTSSGNVGIGKAASLHALDINGNTAINGNIDVSGTVAATAFVSSGTVAATAFVSSGSTVIDTNNNLLNILNLIAIVIPYAGASAPTGWILCYGQGISRTIYAALFAVISTKYGTGDGSTTFNVPDMRGRLAAGLDNMGGVAASRITQFSATTLGATGGADAINLSAAQSGLPAHNHVITDPSHSHSAITIAHSHSVNDPGHNHNYNADINSGSLNVPFCGSAGQSAYKTYTTQNAGTGISINSSTPGVTVNGATTGVSVNSTTAVGAASSHLNVQPTIMLNYIIKY